MSNNISKKIDEIKEYIFLLLENNNLHEIKEMNFIESEQEKKDYISFLLLVLYSELEYFDKQRILYRKSIDNKRIFEAKFNKIIKSLKYVRNNIHSYTSHIMVRLLTNTDDYTQENQEKINKSIEKYQQITDLMIQVLTKEFISPHAESIDEYAEGFLTFYKREINKITTIRNAVLRYICLITQICFGKKYKNKHKLFYQLLIMITNQEWDNFIPEDVKNIVNIVNIEDKIYAK